MVSLWCSNISGFKKYVQGMAGMWSLVGLQQRLCRDLYVLLPPPPLVCCVAVSKSHTFSLSQFPSLEWVWSCWKWEELGKGTGQLCNSTEIKVSAEIPLPFLLRCHVGREESTPTFLFTPWVFLWVWYRISPGCTIWAMRETIDNTFNLAGGFLSFKLSTTWAVCNSFYSYLLSWT